MEDNKNKNENNKKEENWNKETKQRLQILNVLSSIK